MLGVHAEVVGPGYIAEDRRRPGLHHGGDRGDEGERRDDHLVAGADPGGEQRKMQGGRAARGGHHMAGAEVLGEGLLELFDPRPLGPPTGPQRCLDRVEVLLLHLQVEDRDRGRRGADLGVGVRASGLGLVSWIHLLKNLSRRR